MLQITDEDGLNAHSSALSAGALSWRARFLQRYAELRYEYRAVPQPLPQQDHAHHERRRYECGSAYPHR